MVKLNARAVRLLIVTGLPATGKSTFARQLAARYRLPLLAKDAIKETLLDDSGTADPLESRRLSDISFSMLFAQLGRLAATGVDAVLEGNFRAGRHEVALRALPDPEIVQILCRVGETERLRRIGARAAERARHPGHGDLQAARDASNDEFLDLPGERLLLDTSAAAEQLSPLFARLDQWWTACVH